MESTLLPEWEDVSKRTLTVGKDKGIPPSGFQSLQRYTRMHRANRFTQIDLRLNLNFFYFLPRCNNSYASESQREKKPNTINKYNIAFLRFGYILSDIGSHTLWNGPHGNVDHFFPFFPFPSFHIISFSRNPAVLVIMNSNNNARFLNSFCQLFIISIVSL
jgi:hypothetical protein